MASAVAATAAHQQRKTLHRSSQTKKNERFFGGKEWPVSFHLQLHLGAETKHDGMNSVQLLRLPLKLQLDNSAVSKIGNEMEALVKAAGTKFEVLIRKYVPKHSTAEAQSKAKNLITELLIATEGRLFIVSSSKDEKDCINALNADPGTSFWDVPLESLESDSLEIIDSIPLEEVKTICIGGAEKEWGHAHSDEKSPCLSGFLHKFFDIIAHIISNENEVSLDVDSRNEETEHDIEERLEEMSRNGELAEGFEGFLKITTTKDRHGFNGGRTFYFMIKKNSYRSLKKPAGRADSKQSAAGRRMIRVSGKDKGEKAESDLEHVSRKLQTLADRRRKAFKREHGFRLLQGKLQSIWDTMAFNICVLILIVSNFFFTVQQLENHDPSLQSYYENIDLIYTIIFSAGSPPLRPPRPPPRTVPLNEVGRVRSMVCLVHLAAIDSSLTNCAVRVAAAGVVWVRACLQLPRPRSPAVPDRCARSPTRAHDTRSCAAACIDDRRRRQRVDQCIDDRRAAARIDEGSAASAEPAGGTARCRLHRASTRLPAGSADAEAAAVAGAPARRGPAALIPSALDETVLGDCPWPLPRGAAAGRGRGVMDSEWAWNVSE